MSLTKINFLINMEEKVSTQLLQLERMWNNLPKRTKSDKNIRATTKDIQK